MQAATLGAQGFLAAAALVDVQQHADDAGLATGWQVQGPGAQLHPARTEGTAGQGAHFQGQGVPLAGLQLAQALGQGGPVFQVEEGQEGQEQAVRHRAAAGFLPLGVEPGDQQLAVEGEQDLAGEMGQAVAPLAVGAGVGQVGRGAELEQGDG